MPNSGDIKWFKNQFGATITQALGGTPFDLDMLVAIACQETGYIWGPLRRSGMPVPEILQLCVGDTLDRKKTFPKNRADLLRVPGGKEMFASARAALIKMSQHVKGYSGAASNPEKFCKGFGIFQYDMQFFSPATTAYFMGGYADFPTSLARCIQELGSAMKRAKVSTNGPLTDMQKAAVAIAYNSGGYDPKLGLAQGHQSGDGSFYGQNFYNYLQLAHTVSSDPATIPVSLANGETVLPPATSAAVKLPYVVSTQGGLLNVRSTPVEQDDPSNVIRGLPNGHPVSVLSATPTNRYLAIETNLQGAFVAGWAAKKFLAPAPQNSVIEALSLQLVNDVPALPAVVLPLKSGTVIRRTNPASAGSLNESGQPVRNGANAQQLTEQLAEIVAWLAVDSPAHKRYTPRDGLTFCNIYAHDFCHLAGAYLPRVWWSPAAIAKLSAGIDVAPLYGATIDELRANDLFRWLRDFGPQFGWRQTGTLTKLQLAANSGGIGLIVARRKEDGKSGHIVVIVPETVGHRAKWTSAGEVALPLQSQAGSVNFRYGTGTFPWWINPKFAEFSYWIHA